jgi:uncharacterized membrane protein YdfJ with MMPL/SSD domain
MGVGLAFAILLDATLIRGVLLPATMKLLGDRNCPSGWTGARDPPTRASRRRRRRSTPD